MEMVVKAFGGGGGGGGVECHFMFLIHAPNA